MAVIRRLHAPLRSPEDVIPHLGASSHWKEGRSAKCLVDQWWGANRIPPSISSILDQAEEWRGAELIDAFVERCTDLADGRPSHSQSDLLALLGIGSRLGILCVEAKVDEGFDKTVDEWRSRDSSGKTARLTKLCALLKLDQSKIGGLRYQLFHRTAAAIIEAKRYRTHHAAMIVQSWCPRQSGFDDYVAFFDTIGLRVRQSGELSEAISIEGVEFRTSWSSE